MKREDVLQRYTAVARGALFQATDRLMMRRHAHERST